MSYDGISGINIGQAKLDEYKGHSDDAALNSQGKFSNRTVRKFNNKVGSYLSTSPTHSHDLQLQQDRAQKKLNKRRVAVLNDQGDAAKAAKNVNKSPLTANSGGKLEVAPCPDLDKSIKEFLALAKDPLAHGRVGELGFNEIVTDKEASVKPLGSGSTKAIVDPEKFSRRVQKDFAVFLGNTIKSTNTPHGLERLRQTVQQQFNDGQISETQKTNLNKLISKQYDLQLKNFPAYLNSLTSKSGSDEDRHEVAREKLAAIHEMTMAAQAHNPGVVKKHHQMLKAAALDCYRDCGSSTPPRGEDLFKAQEFVQRLDQEASDWLKPVLKLTSQHPERRLEQAAQSVAPQVDHLKLQLDEIPALERSMNDTAQKAVKLMEAMTKLDTEIDQQQEQLATEIRELKEMREKAGDWRRFNLVYQHRRNKNLERQAVLRETITSKTAEKASNRDRYDGLKKSFNSEFQARNELEKAYGKSVAVLAKPPQSSVATLSWQNELTELDDIKVVTEFDKACIHHHLESLAAKFPPSDLDREESFGTTYVKGLAKDYVRFIRGDKFLPSAALQKVQSEGRISNVLKVNIAPDTSSFDDVRREEIQEELIPALRSPQGSSPDISSTVTPESLTTEDADEPLPVATLSAGEFAEMVEASLLEYSAEVDGTDVNQDTINALKTVIEQQIGNQELQEDDLGDLAGLMTYYATTPFDESGSSPQYWTLEELTPGLQAGIDALKEGKTADEAIDAMELKLRGPELQQITDTEETDSVLGDTASIQVSDYVDALFASTPPDTGKVITRENQQQLLQQLAEAHEESVIAEHSLEMVAYQLHKQMTLPPEESTVSDFQTLSDALNDAISKLREQKPYTEAVDTMLARLKGLPGIKHQDNGDDLVEPLEV